MTEDSKKEWNPLEELLPPDPLGRIKTLARDLAWGVINGLWQAEFSLFGAKWYRTEQLESNLANYGQQKWHHKMPSPTILLALGYLTEDGRSFETPYRFFRLTSRAFDLVNEPKDVHVFISYRHYESSALAVLVETRLKLQDQQIGAFTDKDIPLGDDWAKRLEKSIVDCEYFILLLSHDTLSSDWVRQEIDWALESGSQIISICHSGYDLNKTPENESAEEKQARDKLLRWQYHLIREENAKEYHSAMTELVRNLGYSTL